MFLRNMASNSKDIAVNAAKEFLTFLNKSPSPYHAVDESRKRLLAAGFKELKESDAWVINPNDKCFVTRNQSLLIAFAVGGLFKPGNGFTMIGTHTDSPCLKVKPSSKIVKHGYLQIGVQLYGGGIWHTWFDRDLKLAGRVLVKTSTGQIEHKLVHINKPILRVPTIAIHLLREQNEKFEFNKENSLVPVLAMGVKNALEKREDDENSEKHHSNFLCMLSQQLKCNIKDIIDFDLCLADYVPGILGGLNEEFIFCGRLDNLHSTYCALQGFLESLETRSSLENDTNIRMISLFDNEEVGSESAQGAASSIQEHVLRRLCHSASVVNAFERAIPLSLMVSADMAHAIHPNYSEKHEENHRPVLNKGVTLKFNANQRYASTAITASIMKVIASGANVPLQEFATRNDMPCGSTIGPIMSARLGIPTLDLGTPQLSMHSIREMCSTSSVTSAISLFKAYFENYPKTYASISGI